ncbi:MAG TPA: hypothetical protein VMD56_06150 [Steroidobacteraceae bacterium]|nr:hypothetical protein [Steroidobacteraceae bacterium]
MYIRPTAPRTIGGVLDDAVRLYRASFSRCWVLALIGGALSGAFGVYATLHMGALGALRSATGAAGFAAALTRLQAVEHTPGLWVSDVLVTLTWLVVRAALIARQNAIATGGDETLAAAVGFALRRLPSMIAAAFVWAVALTVGLILLIVPAIWLWGQLQLWLVALVAEDIGPLEALRRSWTLVERNWWRASVTVGVAVVIIWVLSLVGGAAAGVGLVFLRTDPGMALLATQLITVVVGIFTMPMLTVVLVAMYHDLRLRRDGGDLAARVSTLQPA